MRDLADERPVFLSTLPARRGERRLAVAVVIVSAAAFLAAVPFAKVQLPQVWAFIPVYQSALAVNDLITAVLLFGQFAISRSKALLVLACGYLFTAAMAVVHGLTFPGLFAAGGLLGAGPQSTAWLYMFWHGGFPLFVVAYALLKTPAPQTGELPRATLALAVIAVVAAVGAAAALATVGQALLPPIMRENHYTSAMLTVVGSVWVASVVALIVLWQQRPHSVLDLWLMVVMCAWVFDIALSAVLNAGRFDLGFYAGRIYGLLAASFVLVVLLLENGMLYARLVAAHAGERRKSGELLRLGAELETANRQLAEKNRQLEEASRLKSEFLANMSHELRTPLNAIIGFSEVLKDGLVGELAAEPREYVTDIFDSGQHLLSLINDILDLSKIEAGKMSLDLEPLAVDTFLRNSLSIVKEKAAAHRIELVLEAAAGLGSTLADARKAKQIVYNLLANAVKFTPDGGRVSLRARLVERAEIDAWHSPAPTVLRPPPPSERGRFLEIAVVDSGRGISPEDAPRLFQAFSQLDASLARATEGTGLGLVLVLKLALLHGGTVALASTPEQGSCFTCWLPWREVGAAPAPAAPRRERAARGDGQALAVIIEDNAQAAALIRLHLEAEGFAVRHASDAASGLELLARQTPALIILDLLLPDGDGWELLARIKAPESPAARVPVIIVSIVADAQKGIALGAAQVLLKPVGRAELLLALEDVGLVPTHSPLKVLIVDDDPRAVELLAGYLAAPGYAVLRAYDGDQGIEACRRERPDLMVVDLMMPRRSGFEVVDALKSCPEMAAMPIVVVTAKTLTAADRDALNGRVAAILEKSAFDRARFVGELRRAMKTRNKELA